MEWYLRRPLEIEQLFELPTTTVLCNFDLYVLKDVTFVDESTKIYLDDCVEEGDIYPPFAQNRGLKWLLFGNMVVDTIIVRTADSAQVDLAASLENFFYYCMMRTISFQFPNVEITDDGLPYMVSMDFSNYLLAQYISGNMTELQRGLDLIEKFLHSKYHRVQELATVGFLEDIQTTWANHSTDSELIFEHLGAESKRLWGKLDDFWKSVKA